jgi:hypothetical protein
MRRFLFLAILLLPTFSLAQTIDAGFPSQSIWVSQSTVVAGENLEIFTALYNGNTSTLKGAVTFTVDGEPVGTKEFELAGGTSNIVSLQWKAVTGEHEIAAMIEDASATLSQQKTTAVVVTVEDPPPPLANATAAVSQVIADTARTATPIIESSINSAYQFTEALRLDAISNLEKVVTSVPKSTVVGTSASNAVGFSAVEPSAPSAVSRITQVAVAAALVTLQSRALFYPLLILALFALLYLLFRWAFRHSHIR